MFKPKKKRSRASTRAVDSTVDESVEESTLVANSAVEASRARKERKETRVERIAKRAKKTELDSFDARAPTSAALELDNQERFVSERLENKNADVLPRASKRAKKSNADGSGVAWGSGILEVRLDDS